jgi:hypothetical protein
VVGLDLHLQLLAQRFFMLAVEVAVEMFTIFLTVEGLAVLAAVAMAVAWVAGAVTFQILQLRTVKAD